MSTTVPEQRGPDLTMLRLIHAALRRDLSRLTAALQHPAGPIQTSGMHHQWELFARQLHGHHEVEDRLVWPVLRRRAGASADDVLEAMSAEHATIDPALARVTAAFSTVSAAPSQEARAALLVELSALANELEQHLCHEERDAIPLVEAHLSQADLDRVTETQRRAAGLRGARVFLPWVLEGATDTDRAHVLTEMPPPLRLLVRRWQHGHDRAVARAFRT